MRVIHIIPSAYNYFDDIRSVAFELVEKSERFGVEAEAFTLQYSSGVNKAVRASVAETAPSRKFIGMATVSDMFDALDTFDIVHIHVPTFGGMGRFMEWRKTHSDIPVVITYYRPSMLTDVFSYCIRAYNAYYLSRLYQSAQLVTFQPIAPAVKPPRGVQSLLVDSSYMLGEHNLTELLKEVQLSVEDTVAAKYALLYDQLLSQ